MNIKTKKIVLTLALALWSAAAFAWGQKGHDTTVAIAERHLTPRALAAVNQLLEGKSPVYYANWLDNASHTPQYAHTKTWHYKNVDAGVEFDDAPLLSTGDIVRALPEQIKVLENPNSSVEDRRLALKMIIHFLGDIHQPMHIGHASDRGGNNWKIKFFGRDTNLHSVWDSNLPEAAHKWSYSEWVDQIDRATPERQQEIIKGSASDWGKETFEICKKVYEATPQGTDVGFDYIAKWTPTVEEQFLKGGLRLASILNKAFDPGYSEK